MQKQEGHCAFSNACIYTGEHRLEGTNRVFCDVHIVAMHAPVAHEIQGTEFARTSFSAPSPSRRRSSWQTYVGVSEVY